MKILSEKILYKSWSTKHNKQYQFASGDKHPLIVNPCKLLENLYYHYNIK